LTAALRVVLASNNAKKLSELRAMLGGLAVQLVAQGELGIAEADEPHHTFIENALAKARHAAAASGGAALADDSGLCVDALAGAPGVVSAHYAGVVSATSLPAGAGREDLRRLQDAANNTRLLAELQNATDRSAYFVSTLVAVRHAQDPQPLVAVGRWPGQLLKAPRGEHGFGYDPLMFIPDLGLSVAEMTSALKNRHSHRARAMAQLLQQLHEVWQL
jgi:XTP/dITP diphosphohydrolase